MRKTKEEAEETRRAILKSALDTFYEKGYSKTTFDEIAKRINLTKGAVYWYFRNKPDLVAALINEYMAYVRTCIDKEGTNAETFDDIVKSFLNYADYILSSPTIYKVAFFLTCQMEWSEAIITKVAPQVASNKDYWCERLKESLTTLQKNGEISANVDVGMLVSVIMNMWAGTLDAYLSKRCQTDLKTMVKESFNLIYNGLKKGED